MPVKSGTFGTFGTFTSVYAGNHRFEAEVQSGTFEVSTGTFGTFEPIKVPLRLKKLALSPFLQVPLEAKNGTFHPFQRDFTS